jgi:hypothetical protein
VSSIGRIQVRHWLLVAVVGATALAAGRPGVGGVVAGGVVMGGSLLLYAIGLRALLLGGRPRLAIGMLSVKLLAFLGVCWMAFSIAREHAPDPVGFVLGVTCFPVAAVWEALHLQRARR